MLYAVLLTYCANCQNYINSLSFLQKENKIFIDYELTAIEKDSFYDVIVKISNATGVLKEAHSFSGDFGKVNKGGKKQLVWDVVKDIEKLNGQIQVELKATLFSNSLIDLDGDGIFGLEDQCPDIFGIKAYNGCPPPLPDSFDIIYYKDFIKLRIAMQCDKYTPTNSSSSQLKRIIDSLKNKTESLGKIEIIGNTSDLIHKICSPVSLSYKIKISQDRAKKVSDEISNLNVIKTVSTNESNGLEAVTLIFYFHQNTYFQKGEEAWKKGNYKEAFNNYIESEKKSENISENYAMLSYCYYSGLGIQIDYKLSKKYAEISMNNGNAIGAVLLGIIENKLGNKDKAKKCFLFAVEHISDLKSKPLGQNRLGYMYSEGLGVQKNLTEAIKWYRKAADQGDALAQNNLGRCYMNGEGLPKDPYEAVLWYRKAAEHGLSVAQNALGSCYMTGLGLEKDPYEAVLWYRKAAEHGLEIAQNNLGSCYFYGEGLPKDNYEAVKWYRKAADQNEAFAQYNLGLCYMNGKGLPKDSYEAVKWFRKAANQDHAFAQHNLGLCYLNGEGLSKDSYEAVKWFKKAADLGNANAQTNLGYCFFNGVGLIKNSFEAVIWYRKAADQGNADAQYLLGFCYEYGQGIVKDNIEAIKWYRKAAEQGHVEAQRKIRN